MRFVRGYDESDPRPVPARTLDAALAASRDYGTVGLELSLGTQASDRMVGEPTTFTKAWFDAWPGAHDAMPVLNAARALKTEQEIERVRLANDICAAAMEHVRGELRPGMKESEAAALWLGYVHGEGTGWRREGRARARLLARLVGRRHQDLHGDRRPAGAGGRTDAVRDLGLRRRLLVRPHEAALPGRAARRLPRARGRAARRLPACGRPLPAGREPRRARLLWSAMGSPRSAIPASRRTRSATASARAPTSRRTRTRQAAARSPRGWCSRSSPAATGTGGGGLRVEDNFLITSEGAEKLSPFPDGVVQCLT